mmetsp:Transcript_25183/g.28002  ORF Transcript_25183/g.28002 Transcript_25183/m.28002 type:complete len:356 (-) Transcript_25183:68-1135(-)
MDFDFILNNNPLRDVKPIKHSLQSNTFDKPKPAVSKHVTKVSMVPIRHTKSDFGQKIRAKKPKTRRERRLYQREELDYLMEKVQDSITFHSSQLQNLDFSGPSKNIDIETNCPGVVLHMAISTAEQFASQFKTGLVPIIPKRNTGAGQGQVGTQFKGCNLRLKPIKSSKIVMVPFPKPNTPTPSATPKSVLSNVSTRHSTTGGGSSVVSKVPKPEFCKVKREETGEAKDAVSALMNLKENSWEAKKRKRRTMTINSAKPLKKRRLEQPTLQQKKKKTVTMPVSKQITVRYRDQSESFGVWYGCLAGHILQHITRLDVFGIGDYSRCYLRDSAGSIVLENAPFFTIHTDGGLFLEH